MQSIVFENAFLLFAGLFAAYSLQRLHPMRLFDFNRIFDKKNYPNTKICTVLKRFALGVCANLMVAASYIAAWKWFGYLLESIDISKTYGQIAGASVVISSSSLVLVSHRIIAGIAVWKQSELFINDKDFKVEKDFEIFLATSAISHIYGGFLFILIQMCIGWIFS